MWKRVALMWKRVALIGTTASAVMVAGLVVAAPASASSGYGIATNGTTAGIGTFQSYGEHFTACDVKTDGYGVQVDWYVVTNTANHGSVHDFTGNDGVCVDQNASIAEGKEVRYRVCLTDNAFEIMCTDYFSDFA